MILTDPEICKCVLPLHFRPGNEWLCSHCSLTFTSASVLNLHTLAHAADDLEEAEIITGLPSDFHSVYHAGEFLVQNGDVQCPQCTQVQHMQPAEPEIELDLYKYENSRTSEGELQCYFCTICSVMLMIKFE
jgi:hypothetical protein